MSVIPAEGNECFLDDLGQGVRAVYWGPYTGTCEEYGEHVGSDLCFFRQTTRRIAQAGSRWDEWNVYVAEGGLRITHPSAAAKVGWHRLAVAYSVTTLRGYRFSSVGQ